MSLEVVRLPIGGQITRGMTNRGVCANSFGREGEVDPRIFGIREGAGGVSCSTEILLCTKKL